MQRKEDKLLKGRLRKAFGDDHGIQWSESLLDDILAEAYREYALYSNGFVGTYDIVSSGTAVQKMPDNFFKVIRAVDDEGKEIPCVSYRRLLEEYRDFRNIRGNKAKYLCFNFDDFGEFRIFPLLPSGTKVGKVYYNMLPDFPMKVRNISAIEHHCLFQMYQFAGKAQAQNSYEEFMRQVSKECSSKVFNGRKDITRTGVYY